MMKKKSILSIIFVVALAFSFAIQASASSLTIGHARNSHLSNAEQVSTTPSSYFTNWNVVLRPTSTDIANKMVEVCKAGCNNNNIRYSQASRLTLYNKAKAVNYDLSRIKDICYCDCSSFMAVCAIAAGVDVANNVTTSNMQKKFVNTGKFNAITVSNTSYLKKGDILLKANDHTAMVMENGSNANASTNNSTITTTKWPTISNIYTYGLSTKNDTKVYKTATSTDGNYGTIYANDLITILSYDSSKDRFFVSYPISGGSKKGYIARSAITNGNVNKVVSKWTATSKITTYKRNGGGATLGYISKGDICYTIYTSGNWKQVIYPISGGYKIGWIK